MLRRFATIGFAAIFGMASAVFYEHATSLDAQPNTIWLTIAPPPPKPVLLTKLRQPVAVAPNIVPIPHRARQRAAIPKPHRIAAPVLNPTTAVEPASEDLPIPDARTPDQVSAVRIVADDYDQAVVVLPDNTDQFVAAPIIVTSLPQPILAPSDNEGEIELEMITGVELEEGISSPSLSEIDEIISDVERHQAMLQEQAGIYGYVAEEAATPLVNDNLLQTASRSIPAPELTIDPEVHAGRSSEPKSIAVDPPAVAVETAAPTPVAGLETFPPFLSIETARSNNDTALDPSVPNRPAVPVADSDADAENNPHPANATDDLNSVIKLARAEPALEVNPPLDANEPPSIEVKPNPVTQDVVHISSNGIDAEAEVAELYFAGRDGDQDSELTVVTKAADKPILMVALPVHKPANIKKSSRRKRAEARKRAKQSKRRKRLAARKSRLAKKPKVVVVQVRSKKVFGSVAFFSKN